MNRPAAPIRFLSVCSGIDAASVAWNPMGWRAAAFSEIEKFPSAVLAHHYPDVPNLGNMTKFMEWPDLAIDLLCGGTPCQSFSVAGLRQGLADPRGNLMLTFGAIAGRYRPRWLVWENVPGVLSSNHGRDFGTFLGMLGELGYGVAYRVLDAQYVRTRRFPFAVPQRRRRVFVVGYLGDWRCAAAVLFDRESLSGHPAPRRKTGERPAPTISARPTGGGGLGTDFDLDGGLIAFGGNNTSGPIDVSTAINAHGGSGRNDFESETFVARAMRGEGFDASEDGNGRQNLVPVAIQEAATRENPDAGPQGAGFRQDGAAYTLEARHHVQAVAFGWQNSAAQGASAREHISPTLDKSKTPAVAFDPRVREGGAMPLAVRRLTPRDCERLQGFPDDYTLIPWRKGMAPDGPRYKALGNSWAVNCAEWIGERIAEVDQW